MACLGEQALLSGAVFEHPEVWASTVSKQRVTYLAYFTRPVIMMPLFQ
jgi:hypothetical protein